MGETETETPRLPPEEAVQGFALRGPLWPSIVCSLCFAAAFGGPFLTYRPGFMIIGGIERARSCVPLGHVRPHLGEGRWSPVEERHPDGVKGEGLGGVQTSVGAFPLSPGGYTPFWFSALPNSRGGLMYGEAQRTQSRGFFTHGEKGMGEMRSAP